ncbi:MAG: MarR family winged helix-turn-helix transcriptional regulator [Phycisphaerales bacterium]
MAQDQRDDGASVAAASGACEASAILAGEGANCPDCVHDLPLIIRFFIIHNTTMRIGDRLTAPLGLTSSRWLMLCAINRRADEPPRISDLSADAMLSAQNVSRMVASLEEEGLVERFTVAGAGRATYVRLTERGREVIDACDRLGERFDEWFLARLHDADVDLLKKKLDILIENLSAFERYLDQSKESRE